MEQQLNHWLQQLHEYAPNSIGDMLHFEIGPCDVSGGSYTMRVGTEKWMCNAFGSLHGGMIATALDQSMGMLAMCLMEGKAITPTVQLNTTFHHFLVPGEKMLLHIYVEAHTKTMLHLRAEIMSEAAPERLCASATGIFYLKMAE